MTQFQQPPAVPLEYASALPPPHRGRGRRRFLWLVLILVAFALFMLMRSGAANQQSTTVPLSDFTTMLEAGKFSHVAIDADELVGTPRAIVVGAQGQRSRTTLPQGMGANWNFIQWLLESRHGATIEIENNNSLLINILLPLLPWLLIFFFLWFFIYRVLRGAKRTGQLLVTGPGRWIPDSPAAPTESQ